MCVQGEDVCHWHHSAGGDGVGGCDDDFARDGDGLCVRVCVCRITVLQVAFATFDILSQQWSH